MILGTTEILRRLNRGEIFRKGSWQEASVKEASYALRVANDAMVVDGKVYKPGKVYPQSIIEIKPGRIAILSTEEYLCMPKNLVGKLGVRLDFASRGLTGLMGIQVDPYYGSDYDDERLYIKVANFGNETVSVHPGDAVFNIEFAEVKNADRPSTPKRRTWDRLMENLINQEHSDWTYIAKVQTDFNTRTDSLDNKFVKRIENLDNKLIDGLKESDDSQQRGLSGIRNSQQSVVMFGVFLVAITILAVAISAILNVENAPSWLTNWGWIFLLVLCGIATLALTGFVVVAGWAFGGLCE